MKVAIAHDYLTQRGGAERVVLSMLRAFPTAAVHTSLYDPGSCFPEYKTARVQPSPLNVARPLRMRHRLAFPLLAPAFSAMHIDADVTLVSSSGWAHGVRTSGTKIVYCHAPARWLYQRNRYLDGRGPLARMTLRAGETRLRAWDRAAARTADHYLVNSLAIRDQVQRVYGIDADVLHPPVTIDVDGPHRPVPGLEPGYAMCVSRLQSYKNVDVIIDAMRHLPDARLVVVGIGPLQAQLRARAGHNVTFVGQVADDRLRWLYANAGVLVGASFEDFGLTPIEAAAFGVPTVALRFGGYLDTVRHDTTGLLFEALDDSLLARSLADALTRQWDRQTIREHAGRFSEPRFIDALRAIVVGPNKTEADGVPLDADVLQRA
jgi:glycosyltransferase involved in cell wall biosynthesis